MQDQLKGVQLIQASHGAFAAILTDGSVVTWGRPGLGGDSRAVQDQLKGVQQILASHQAFAAILTDGSVVTWGSEPCKSTASVTMTVHVAVATFVVYHSTVARLEALYNIGSKLPHIYMKMVEDGNYFTSYIYI